MAAKKFARRMTSRAAEKLEDRNMSYRRAFRWNALGALILITMLSACAPKHVEVQEAIQAPPVEERETPGIRPPEGQHKAWHRPDYRTKRRVVTESELARVGKTDPELTRMACLEILARLNRRARYYIPDDIKHKRRMIVPNDFRAYKKWTPLPRYIRKLAKVRKFILVVKNITFLGWYSNGRLIRDTQVCIGRMWQWTKAGMYRVLDKDANHFSQSYPDAEGRPTPMPLALRIYQRVWIHTGDVIGGFCSHGCINLPLELAEKLFNWADKGTPVLILDSLKGLDVHLEKYAHVIASR
jgi:lipoprotein-anchoring transpeptidase ErfK/SrfK